MMKITFIALLLSALTIGTASAYAADSDVVCAEVYAPCNEDGTVKAEFASGPCVEKYQTQCDKEFLNTVEGLKQDLTYCQGSLLNALEELQQKIERNQRLSRKLRKQRKN